MGIFSSDEDYCLECARVNKLSIAEIADERINKINDSELVWLEKISDNKKSLAESAAELQKMTDNWKLACKEIENQRGMLSLIIRVARGDL
jgi:hypothetical protein